MQTETKFYKQGRLACMAAVNFVACKSLLSASVN